MKNYLSRLRLPLLFAYGVALFGPMAVLSLTNAPGANHVANPVGHVLVWSMLLGLSCFIYELCRPGIRPD